MQCSEAIRTDLWAPITEEDISQCRISASTAAGPDALSGKDFAKKSKVVLLRLFNLFMWCGSLTESPMASKTIFIPKKGFEDDLSKYRPFTNSSEIVRAFHQVPAARIAKAFDIDERQRGFRDVDGCLDNVSQLDMTLRQQYLSFKPLYMASLDVAKAFPSVSHKALLMSMSSSGVPPQFVEYLERLYGTGYTILQGMGWSSDRIYPRQGVRQGDQLSSPLFYLVTLRTLQALPDEVGVKVGEKTTNSSVFADDINTYGSKRAGLRFLIEELIAFLSSCGMSINVDKSFTLGFLPSGREKENTVDIRTRFEVSGRHLRALTRTEE